MSDRPADRAQADPFDTATALLAAWGRDDLVDRSRAAKVRAARPAAVVCVVGEFKQGKSSLVNSLVGHEVCPVDDDIATSVLTLVRYGEQPAAVVRSSVDGRSATERIALADVARHVTEQHTADSDRVIDRVDIAIPSPLLTDGLVLVDSPGAGGMSGGHAAATLGFLPFADGLVFVTDLTSELTAPEVAFLEQARDRCPNVMVVETKSDLTPHWRRIDELNRGHLARLGLDLPVLPCSSVLAAAARRRGDAGLLERSGLPDLERVLRADIVRPAKAEALSLRVRETIGAVDLVDAAVRDEIEALSDPARQQELADRAADASSKLEQLRGPGARWNVLLGDRVADLSSHVSHGLRSAMRDVNRSQDERIEELRTAQEWEEMSVHLQQQVAGAVSEAFLAVESGRLEIREQLAELIAWDEATVPPGGGAGVPVDVLAVWRARAIDPDQSAGSKAFRTGLTGLRGAQGGIMLLGVGGRFLPQAASVFVFSNPVLLGVGAIFGGMQLLDERKRRIQARRQSARTQLRQFIDDVQFQVGNELSGRLRDVQRELRDEFSSLIGELQRTWADAAKRAEQARTASAEQAAQRAKELHEIRGRVSVVRAKLEELQP